MNREIKFRCWDGEEKTMYYSDNDLGCFFSSFDGMPMMQFTGLLDKNGKEIYEGDVVTVPNMDYDPSNGDNPLELIEVKYKLGVFHPLQDCESEEMEIIGNIYENPELLTPTPPAKGEIIN